MKKLLYFILLAPTLYAQKSFTGYEHLFTDPRHYITYKASAPITIDGKMNEADWIAAPWSETFTDIEGSKKPEPRYKTRFKMLWDDTYLYVAAEIEDPHIWANIKEHDEVVFYDNDFEVFIDPNGDTHNYYEIEVNTYNTFFDLFLPKPYRVGGLPLRTWDVQKMKSAITVDGTLNNTTDIDKKWVVEMAIPLRSISIGDNFNMPTDKTLWRINFSRVQWDTEIVNDKYVKKTDPLTKRTLAENNWVWSPQGVVNMHLPERWGYMQFSTENPSTANSKKTFELPVSEQIKKHLFLLYYKQTDFQSKNNRFATSLEELGLPLTFEIGNQKYTITIDASKKQYSATAQSLQGNEKWQINQESEIKKSR